MILLTDKELIEINKGYKKHVNPYVISGYRKPCNCYHQCFESIFSEHNETINIWTHLLGIIIFLYYYFYILTYKNLDKIDKIVVTIYFITILLLLFFSTLYHTMISHSVKVADTCQCIDWFFVCVTILVYSFFVSYFELYKTGFQKYFYIFNVILILFFIFLSYKIQDLLTSPEDTTDIQTFILSSFSSFVLIAWIIHYILDNKNTKIENLYGILLAYLFYSTVFLKINSIPECLSPGTFDIFGYSHQIFHIGILFGIYTLFTTYV